MDFPQRLLTALRAAPSLAVLTGAGVSAESGLATFRDAQTGLWARYRPEELATPQAFAQNPKLVWDWYAERRAHALAARPNPAHKALVEMENHVPDFTLITQNVDGLHQEAGSRSLVPLHGDLRRVRCAECGHHPSAWPEDHPHVPPCPRCGGLLRPDVVWFNEPLPAEALRRAVAAAQRAQVFLVVGTSAVVEPAASLWRLTQDNGGLVVEVNPQATRLSPRADYRLRGKAGEVLPRLVAAAWGG